MSRKCACATGSPCVGEQAAFAVKANKLLLPFKILMAFVTAMLVLVVLICLGVNVVTKMRDAARARRASSQTVVESSGGLEQGSSSSCGLPDGPFFPDFINRPPPPSYDQVISEINYEQSKARREVMVQQLAVANCHQEAIKGVTGML